MDFEALVIGGAFVASLRVFHSTSSLCLCDAWIFTRLVVTYLCVYYMLLQGDAFGFMKLCAFIITELKNLSAASRASAGSSASAAAAAAAGKSPYSFVVVKLCCCRIVSIEGCCVQFAICLLYV